MKTRWMNMALIVMIAFCCVMQQGGGGVAWADIDDQFNDSTLSSGWEISAGRGSYSLTDNPGYLRYIIQGRAGGSNSTDPNWPPSLGIYRAFTGSKWILHAKAIYHIHGKNNGESTGAQYQQITIDFDNTNNDVHFNRGVDWWYNRDNPDYTNGLLMASQDNAGQSQNLVAPDDVYDNNGWISHTYWYEIERDGNQVFMRYSYDGETYRNAYTASLPNEAGDNQRVLIDASVWSTAGSYVDWDFIKIVPEIPTKTSPADDLALHADTSASDNGWGGGANKSDLTDGIRAYDDWARGLAFQKGWNQVTIDFGKTITFNKVMTWWQHGAIASTYSPKAYRIENWNGTSWVEIFSTTNPGDYLKYPNAVANVDWWYNGSAPTENIFPPVTGSKVRLWSYPKDGEVMAGYHTWIDEVEVYNTAGTVTTPVIPPLAVTTSSLPSGTINTHYQSTLIATGGTPPYTWSCSGSLPAGLSLSTGGVISGTPTNAGTFAFTARVSDSAGSSTAKGLSIYLAAASEANLVGYYKFDSNANDSSGFGNNGVIHGAVPASDRFGNLTGALSFDGANNYISVPHSSSLNITGDLTIAMWICPQMPSLTLTGADPGIAFVSKRTTNSPEPYTFDMANGGFLRFAAHYTGAGNWRVAYTDTDKQVVKLNEWQHLAVTRRVIGNDVTISFYRNGTLLKETTNAWGLATANNQEMWINKDPYFAAYTNQGLFKGLMDDLMIYNRALSTAEIQSMVQEISITPTPSKTSPADDLALHADTSASDNGWGGGANKSDLTDGIRAYDDWARGLAFQKGWNQVTIDFGKTITFNKVMTWWQHGATASTYSPKAYRIENWNGTSWVEIFSTTNPGAYLKYPNAVANVDWWYNWSVPTENIFLPVTGSKVRLWSYPKDGEVMAGYHTWIDEVEVYNTAGTVTPPLNITTTSLPSGTISTRYQTTLTATGGTPPYNWSCSGSLPAGLSLSSGGIISGTPTNVGTFAFTAQVSDSAGSSTARGLSIYTSIAVASEIQFPQEELSLDENTVLLEKFNGSTTGEVFGNVGYIDSIPNLNKALYLPANSWIRFSPNGLSQLTNAGSIEFFVAPTAYNGLLCLQWSKLNSPPSDSMGYVLHIALNSEGRISYGVWNGQGDGGLTGVTPIPLNSWSHICISWNNSGSKIYVNGKLDASTPQKIWPSSPQYVYLGYWGVTNAVYIDELRISKNARVRDFIAPPLLPLNLPTTSLPSGTANTHYQAALTATGGTPPYTWSYSGSLPAGLSLSANGLISGTPTNAGTVTFTAQVSDSAGNSTARELSIYIAATSIEPVITSIQPVISSYEHSPCDEFDVQIQIGSTTCTVSDLFGVSFKLNYDTILLDVVTPYNTNITPGSMLGSDVVFIQSVDEAAGQVNIGVSRKGGQAGVSGNGDVAKIRFRVNPLAAGSSTGSFSITNVTAINSSYGSITLIPKSARIHIVQRLAVPGLIFPGDNALANQVDLNYEWTAVTDAGCYRFELDNNSDFSSPKIAATTTSTVYNPTSLYGPSASSLPDDRYYWRVKACGTGYADSSWSDARCVRVTTVVLNPQIPATITTGSAFVVDVRVGSDTRVAHTYPANDLFAVSFSLFYERTDILNVATPTATTVEAGDFLGTNTVLLWNVIEDNGDGRGRVDIAISRKAGNPGVTGYGSLASVKFTSVGTATGVKFQTSDVGHHISAYNSLGEPVDIAGWTNTMDIQPQPEIMQVWPGDTNNDGSVNEQDIFPLAIYWNTTSSARPDASMMWTGQPMLFPWTPAIATYADSNGDGVVNSMDIMAVGINWGATHTVSNGGSHAPALLATEIDHAKYLEAYRAMYKMLEENGVNIAGAPELKQELVAVIKKGVIEQEAKVMPSESILLQNYPNPFNPECWIPFELSEKANVVIRIYNISGQLVKTLDLGELPAGAYTTQSRAAYWNGRNEAGDEIASGVYFYQMQAGNKVMTKRAVVLK